MLWCVGSGGQNPSKASWTVNAVFLPFHRLRLCISTPDLLSSVASFLRPEQEVQQIFKAKHPMDTEVTKAKVRQLVGSFTTAAFYFHWNLLLPKYSVHVCD